MVKTHVMMITTIITSIVSSIYTAALKKKCALRLVLHALHHRVVLRYYSPPPLLYTGTDKQLSGAVKEEGRG